MATSSLRRNRNRRRAKIAAKSGASGLGTDRFDWFLVGLAFVSGLLFLA